MVTPRRASRTQISPRRASRNTLLPRRASRIASRAGANGADEIDGQAFDVDHGFQRLLHGAVLFPRGFDVGDLRERPFGNNVLL